MPAPYYPPYYPQQAPALSSHPPPAPAHEDASPPGSVKALKRQLRGLKAAQSITGQEPAAMAARAQQMDGVEADLDERQRKFRKYGQW